MRFKIEGLETIEPSDPRVTLHRLADGSTLVIASPPTRGGEIPEETHAAAMPVRHAAKAFAALELARRGAAKDPMLSDAGREQKVKGPRADAFQALDEADSQIAQLEASTAGLRDQAFAPPMLDRADVNGALVDQEIRAEVRRMSPAEINDYLPTIKANTRHLEALQRTPMPIQGVSEFVDRLWTEKLQDSPAAVRARAYAEAIEWARGALGAIRGKV